MKVISVMGLKGGVGKTTTTAAMAEDLAIRFKKRVLLIDNDKQGNLSRLYKWFSMDQEAGACEMLKTSHISSVIEKTEVEKIDIVPCNYYMEYAEVFMNHKKSIELDHYKKAFSIIAHHYDCCIIDNPPDFGVNVINALVASDDIIIPANLDAYSIEGLKELVQQVDEIKKINSKLKLAGCLITNAEKSEYSTAAEEWLREKGFPVFKIKIRHSKRVCESTFSGQSIMRYSIRSAAAQDYKKFINEYIGGGNGK